MRRVHVLPKKSLLIKLSNGVDLAQWDIQALICHMDGKQ